MNLQEIIVKPDREPESLHQTDDESDGITLTQFKVDDPLESWLREMSEQLVGLENSIQVRMVLKLYLEDMLEDVKWGGTEV